MWMGVQDLSRQLNSAGKRVILLAGIPEPGVDVPWASAINLRFGRPALRLACHTSAIPLSNVTVIDVSEAFCSQPRPDELFTDNNHPSRTAGLRIIAPAFQRLAFTERLEAKPSKP
jgi:hypothetical protein